MSAKYILISVVERNIYTKFFDNENDAIETMKNEFLEALGYDDINELLEDYDAEGDYANEDNLTVIVNGLMSEYDAYFNNCQAYCDGYDGNYDWSIIKLP